MFFSFRCEPQNGDSHKDAKMGSMVDARNRKDANFLWQNVCKFMQPSTCMCAIRSTAALTFLYIAEGSYTFLGFDALSITFSFALCGKVDFAIPCLTFIKTYAVHFMCKFLATLQSHENMHRINVNMCASGSEFLRNA